MVIKALIWWGYCYEKDEKLKKAKEDFILIKSLNPHENEANNALRRIEQALKH